MVSKIQTSEDLKKALIQKLEKLQEALGCDLITLHLYDAERDRVFFPVGIGLLDEDRFYRSVPSRKRGAGKIIRSKKPILAPNAQHHPDLTGPFTHIEKVRSAFGFPLLVGQTDEVLGFVFINYRKDWPLSDAEIEKITKWIGSTSKLVVRVFSNDVGQRLKSSLRIETDLRRKEYQLALILRQIRNVIRDVDVIFWMEKKREKVLSISVSEGVDLSHVQDTELSIVSDSDNLVIDTFVRGKEQQVENLRDRPDTIINSKEQLVWERAYLLPIFSEYHKIGVLGVFRCDSHEFNHREQDELHTFARLMAVTTRNEERIVVQNALHDLGIALALYREPNKILNEVVRSACEILDADIATVLQYDPERQTYLPLEDAAVYPPSAYEYMDLPRPGGFADTIIRKQRIFVEDVDQNEDPNSISSFIGKQGIKAYAGLPLVSGDQPLGILYVSFKYPRHFSPDNKVLIQLLADNAATAINNARLYQQTVLRASALENLHIVGRDLIFISEKPDALNSVLRQIANSALAVLDADLVDLYQYYQDMKSFKLPPIQVGKRYVSSIIKDKVLDDDILLDVIKRENPLYVTHADDEIFRKPFDEEKEGEPAERFVVREKIEASAAIPLSVGGEYVGVMFANFRSRQYFPEHQKTLIELFANQAAIAIHNSRLYEESLQTSRQLELVREVAAKVSSATDIDEILQFVVNGLANIFKVQQSAVALFDDTGEFSIVQAEYLVEGRASALGVKIPLIGNLQIEEILKSKKPVVVQDVQSDPQLYEILAERGTLSIMIVPIVVDGEVIGTVGVDAVEKPRYFTDDDARLAQAIADQAAAAIRIARQLEDRLGDIRALRNITEHMHRGNLRDVLDSIAEQAVEITGAKYGGVWLLNRSGTSLELGGLAGAAIDEDDPPNISVTENSENSISKYVVQNKKTHLSPDVDQDVHYKKWYRDTRSELTVPLIYGNRLIGTINVESVHVNGFSDDHRRLLEAMAGQVAIVVQNARLKKNLELLNDIGNTLTFGTRLKEDEILELIFSQAQKLTDAQDMYIALYDEDTNEIRFPLVTEEGKRVEYSSRKADMDKRGKTEEIIFTRESILHKTKKEAEVWYEQPGHAEFVGLIQPSWLGVPMIVGEKVIGVIAVYDLTHEHAYDEQDLHVFSSMASQAAIALDNASLYTSALFTLNAVGRTLTAGVRLREDEILELIFSQAQKLTDTSDMYIALYDEDTNEIRFPLVTEEGKRVEYSSRKADMDKRGKTEEIIFTRESILHKTKKEAEVWYKQPGHAEFVGLINPSWLGVPMIVGEKVIGVIAVYDLTHEKAYNELHLAILSSMASQAAMALDNATLYYDVNQKLEAANIELEKARERELLTRLGEIAAGLIHKMGNTIGAVPALVKRIEKSIDTKEVDAINKLNQVRDGVMAALEYVNNMGKILSLGEVDKEKANLPLLISDAIHQTQVLIDQNEISLIEEYSGLPNIYVNTALVIEVFRNLLQNAVESMSSGGKLQIVGTCEIEKLVIEISDTGCGILKTDESRLFALGFSTKKDGTGIGLWFSRTVIEEHQGTISYQSEPGKGTIFRITLPVGCPADAVDYSEQEISNV